MAKLYSNEIFPLPVVEELRRLGHDVVTTQEADNAGRALPDREVLDYAIDSGRTVLTLNRKHFIRLHLERPSHAGIIVCTFDPDFVSQAHRIYAAIQTAPQVTGHLIRVNRA